MFFVCCTFAGDLHLLSRGFAREVSEEELSSWTAGGNPTYYVAHQMAPNPTSKTTPVRVVFNSSQNFKGYSLNTSWYKGPDMLNSMVPILLRFREGNYAAQGDMSKMYYMVRITEAE